MWLDSCLTHLLGAEVGGRGCEIFAKTEAAAEQLFASVLLERECRATRPRAGVSGPAFGPRSGSVASSLGEEGTVSPTKRFLVLLHQLTHPSTTDVFTLLARRCFTWRF